MAVSTYGLRNIIRSVASGPRWNRALSASRMCSLAAPRSSAWGTPAVTSVAEQKDAGGGRVIAGHNLGGRALLASCHVGQSVGSLHFHLGPEFELPGNCRQTLLHTCTLLLYE